MLVGFLNYAVRNRCRVHKPHHSARHVMYIIHQVIKMYIERHGRDVTTGVGLNFPAQLKYMAKILAKFIPTAYLIRLLV